MDSPLHQSAVQGLQAEEDYSQVELRRTSLTRKYTDPFSDLMLIHVKGRKHVQVRLVEPKSSSLCSDDCFVLVTPETIYCWLGKMGNVIEKNKAKEISLLAFKRKDMGFTGTKPVVIIEEGKSLQEKEMLRAMGGALPRSDNEFEDEDYERIHETNRVYSLIDDTLVEDTKWTGQLPKYEMLQNPEAVIVFDFGTELYVWFGPKCSPEDRETGLKLGQELWDKGVDFNSSPNPFRPFKNEGFSGKRPDWCLFGKINQNIETELFKDKFIDWPDSRENRPFSEDFENRDGKDLDSRTCNVLQMLSENKQPVTLSLEGTHVGRGRKWTDVKDDFFSRDFDIITKTVNCWHVQDNGHSKLEEESCGQFHESDTYVVRWEYIVTPTNVKGLDGKMGRLSLTGRDRCAYFFWHVIRCGRVNEKGASALMTVELDLERGPHVGVTQGQEPPCFTQLFDGKMIVHNGKRGAENENKTWKLFVIRNEIEYESYLLEVPCRYSSLRARTSFLLLNTQTGAGTIIHGQQAPQNTRDCIEQLARNLKNFTPKELSMQKPLVLESFTSKFYSAFEDYDKNSDLDTPVSVVEFSPRLFHLAMVSGQFQSKEVLNPCRSEAISPLPFDQEQIYDKSIQPAMFLLDIDTIVYLWQGWMPEGYDPLASPSVQNGGSDRRFQKLRKMSLEITARYCKKKKCPGEIVIAGHEGKEFRELFPCWEHSPEAESSNLDEITKLKDTFDVTKLLSRYSRSYSYNDLIAKPDGVDTSKMESYLCESEFEDVFKMPKDAFYQQPMWKQIAMRKKAGLF